MLLCNSRAVVKKMEVKGSLWGSNRIMWFLDCVENVLACYKVRDVAIHNLSWSYEFFWLIKWNMAIPSRSARWEIKSDLWSASCSWFIHSAIFSKHEPYCPSKSNFSFSKLLRVMLCHALRNYNFFFGNSDIKIEIF